MAAKGLALPTSISKTSKPKPKQNPVFPRVAKAADQNGD